MSTTLILEPLDLDRAVVRTRVRGEVRLTRRGRAVVFVLALLAVLAVGLLVAGGSAATDEAGTPEQLELITVGPGDTLWDIATVHSGGADVREAVAHIQDLNALEGGSLVVGQELRVPQD